MKLIPINTGFLSIRLADMFVSVTGESPEIRYPVDDMNRAVCTVRSLLLIAEYGNVLIDTGVGTLIDKDILSHYDYRPEGDWDSLLLPHGLTPAEISDVILTHLHFDHCGGSVRSLSEYRSSDDLFLTFPNASHWVSHDQWEWAQKKEEREPDSFFEHTFLPIRQQGRLKLVENETELLPGIHVRFFHGHTHGLMIPIISVGEETVVFTGDLIPTFHHLIPEILMSYDIDPILSQQEKIRFLEEAKDKGWKLFFQHDHSVTYFERR